MYKIFSLLGALLLLVQLQLEACSMFKITSGGKTLVGNNEDYQNPNTWLWVRPPAAGSYGVVYFGFENFFAQGGINEKGLVFDGFATGHKEVKNRKGKKAIDAADLIQLIMTRCATTEEVKALVKQYDLQFLEYAQLMFVDKGGASIILEGDAIISSPRPYQISTNFYQSNISRENPISCTRYLKGEELLAKSQELSISHAEKVLASMHQASRWGGTQYSNLYDLDKGIINLYLFHNFQERVVLPVDSLLKLGHKKIELHTLFKDKSAYLAYRKNYYRAESLSQQLAEVADVKAPLAELRQNEQAIVWLDQLIQAAAAQLQKGKSENALEVLKLSEELSPNNWRVQGELARVYLQRKDYQKSALHLENALQLQPQESSLLETRAKLKRSKGE